MKKFFRYTFIIILIIGLIAAAILWFYKDNFKFKLMRRMITTPLGEIIRDYSLQSCDSFSQAELKSGEFEALVTGYCRPKSNQFKNRHDFLCSVGLNCACPNGRENTPNCTGKNSLSWSACKEFDDKQIAYCDKTALQIKPQAGHAAADWKCFKANSKITINGQEYTIADKGSAITGRRFDLWFDDCQAALNAIGIYKVKIPSQYVR